MKLDAPIIELQFALSEVEKRLKAYFPPTCKSEKEYNALNEVRNQYITAIKILEIWENT